MANSDVPEIAFVKTIFESDHDELNKLERI